MPDTTQYSRRDNINGVILFVIPFYLLLPITLIVRSLDEKKHKKTKDLYENSLVFGSANALNIGIFGGIAYGVLSKIFPDGIIPGMPKGFNTPAAVAFGIVTISSLLLTSLVAGIAYHKAPNDEKLDSIPDALTYANPATGLVNVIDFTYDKVANCCKSNKGHQLI